MNIPDTFIHLPGYNVPPEFWPAYEYSGEARYVALYWTPYGDEAMINDGSFSGDANWRAHIVLTEHPENVRIFCETARMPTWVLGSSDEEGTHWLIVDRRDNAVYLAPADDANRFLRDQWPTPERELTQEEMAAIFEAFNSAIAQINAQAIKLNLQNLLDEDDKRIKALQSALERADPTTQLITPTLPGDLA